MRCDEHFLMTMMDYVRASDIGQGVEKDLQSPVVRVYLEQDRSDRREVSVRVKRWQKIR